MSNEENTKKDLINFAFTELTKAIGDTKNGKTPISSYNKLKVIYDTLSAAEKRRELGEISDEDMQITMAEEVEKLKTAF